MFKIIAVLVIVLLVGVLIYAATRPDIFRVQRSTSIKAPAETIYGLINDLHRWGAWSPWEKKDPSMKRSHTGAANGKGAVYEWEGNKDVGQGRMEIATSSPPSEITIKLDFVKPFEAHNIVEFTLKPEGDSTNVTWSMQGDLPYFAKVIHLFLDMDKMVGTDFEVGLAAMKTVAEQPALRAPTSGAP
ncbi:MAG: SRPBCC family protein [Gammaproteobacteria bacterium]